MTSKMEELSKPISEQFCVLSHINVISDNHCKSEKSFNRSCVKFTSLFSMDISNIVINLLDSDDSDDSDNSDDNLDNIVQFKVNNDETMPDFSLICSQYIPVLNLSEIHKNKSQKDIIKNRIHDANKFWNQNYNGYECRKIQSNTVSVKHIMFKPQTEWEIIYEDFELSEDLRLSRISEHIRRKADHERMKRLLGPIFNLAHREKMWTLIYRDKKFG